MEEKIGSLIDALTRLVDNLEEKSTKDVVSEGRLDRPDDDFHDPVKEKEKEFKKQAEIHEKERSKKEKKKKDPRKILKTIMPVSIVEIDKKALKQLAKIIPTGNKIKEKIKKEEPPKQGLFDFLKMVGLGVLATVLAPVVAFVAMFKEIGNQKWFISLKNFVKDSKIGKMIGSALTTIKKAFTSLGTRFPKIGAMVGKLFGKGGTLTGIFSKITTMGKTVMDLVKSTKIGAIAGKVGKLMGKIFAPVMIVWGVIETVMGAVKGYKEDGVAGAIKGGVNSLFDFLVVDLVNLIVSIPAWFLEKIGLKNVAKSLKDNVAGILQSIKDMFGGIVDTAVGVFTLNPARIKKGLKDLFGGAKDFVGFVLSSFVDPVINFLVKDVFKWGDPESPFSFKKDVLDPAVNKVKRWFKGLLSLGDTEDGGWSLTAFINGVETKVIEFFTGIFAWGDVTDEKGEKTGEWSLGTFVGTAVEKAKEWVVGLFSWADPAIIFSLVDQAKEVWGEIKSWFTGLIKWADTDTDEKGNKDGFIISTVKGVVKNVKQYFEKLFTFDSAKSITTSVINIATWLPNLVVSGLGGVSAWFLELFGFEEGATKIKEWTAKFSIGDLVVGAVTKVWEWFKGRFPDASAYITKKWDELTDNVKDIGSWIWDKVKNIWNWIKKLWMDPKKTIEDAWNTTTGSIKSIGDWLKKKFTAVGEWISGMFTDIVGDIKTGWTNTVGAAASIGAWLKDKFVAVGEWFTTLFSDPKTAIKEAWENMLEGALNIGSWIGGKLKSAWESLTDLIGIGSVSDLIPDSLKDIGSYVWSKVSGVWDSITEVFDNIVNFDVKGYIKNEIKSKGGVVGEKIYDFVFGDEDAAAEAASKEQKAIEKTVAVTGAPVSDETIKNMDKARERIEDQVLGDAYQKNMESVYDSLDNLLESGEGKEDKIYMALQRAAKGMDSKDFEDKEEIQELMNRLNIGGLSESDRLARKELAAELAKGYTNVTGFDDTNQIGDAFMTEKARNFANQEVTRVKNEEMVSAYMEQLKTEGINLGDKKYSVNMLSSGKTDITQPMIDSYRELQAKYEAAQGADKEQLGYYMKALEQIGVSKQFEATPPSDPSMKQPITPVNRVMEQTQQVIPEQQLPSRGRGGRPTKYYENLKVTSELPDLNTDQAADNIRVSGESINTGTQNLADVVKSGFPEPSSPYAWEYLRMSGENINDGSRRIYEQSLEYKKAAESTSKTSDKNNQALINKVDQMVEIMAENSETHKKTLEVLEQHGLIDKQGNTVVNNGGNSTVVNNMTVESGIMQFRDRVVGRLNTK